MVNGSVQAWENYESDAHKALRLLGHVTFKFFFP